MKTRAWEAAVGACVIVWACVFIGVVVLGAKLFPTSAWDAATFVKWVNMFAAGALLGTAFTLTLPEAAHLIEEEYEEEAEVAGYWGALVLVGFVTSLIIDMMRECIMTAVTSPKPTPENSTVVGDVELGAEKKKVKDEAISTAVTTPQTSGNATVLGDIDHDAERKKSEEIKARDAEVRYSVISAAIVGDFFHNFCDGVFIGAAFKSCSLSLAWTVASSTVFHELAQEISDFFVFTQRGGLSVLGALTVNALCGLSVILGGIIVSAQSLDEATIGFLLAFGAGNYIYLGATELFPIIHEFKLKEKVVGLVLFATGAIAVGLVLLNHEHCE